MQSESRDRLRHRVADPDEGLGQVVDQPVLPLQHLGHLGEVGEGLPAELLRVGRRRLAEALEVHPVGLGEGPLGLPEGLAVRRGVRRPVARVVVLEVAPPLARSDVDHPRDPRRVLAAQQFGQGRVDPGPVAAVSRFDHAPAVRLEPVARRAVHHARDRVVVDPEVVPVDDVHQVVEPEAPGAVLRLVRRPGGEPSLPLEGEDADLSRPGPLEGHRLARRGRAAVPGRAGIELEEEGLPFHLRVPREPAVAAEGDEVLGVESAPGGVGDGVARVAGPAVLDPQRLVKHREGPVDQRRGVPGNQDEPVREAFLRMPEVPAHVAAEERRHQDVHLRA